MERFISRPVPPELRSFIENLEAEHRTDPFPAYDLSRTSIARVEAIADRHQIASQRFRGKVALKNAEVDTVWLAVMADKQETPLVIDVSLPLKNERFGEMLRWWVAGEDISKELEATAALATFEDRIFGEFPDTVSYIGSVVLLQKQAA